MLRSCVAVCAGVVIIAACAADQPLPTEFELTSTVFVQDDPAFARGGQRDFNFRTHLSGNEEVFTPESPGDLTPADSRAQGQAIFRVSGDGSMVSFRLIATNIENVVMAHIHCGPRDFNGPISIWLYPVVGLGTISDAADPGAGRHSGVLNTGTFSPVGVDCPAAAVGMDDPIPLLDAMRAGLTYVNVHTNDGVGAPNTGPGDFPGGEIRGQIEHAGGHGNF